MFDNNHYYYHFDDNDQYFDDFDDNNHYSDHFYERALFSSCEVVADKTFLTLIKEAHMQVVGEWKIPLQKHTNAKHKYKLSRKEDETILILLVSLAVLMQYV